MINDKQFLQMIERLGKNSRISKSLAASEVSETDKDTKCAKTLRNIIENSGTSTRSLAAAAAIPSPNPNHNVNKVRVLTDFVFRNKV